MEIVRLSCLTNAQKQEIQILEELCAREDSLKSKVFLSNELSFDKSLPCFYLGFQDGQLVSFLSTFIPTREEAEISAFTHPQHRRKGYFNRLLEQAAGVLKGAGVPRLLFVAESQSKSAAAVLGSRGCTAIDHTEYTMEFSGQAPAASGKLRLEPLSRENKLQVVAISSAIFGMADGEENFIQNALEDSCRSGFLVMEQKQAVGFFSVHFEGKRAYLYGLGLLENHRGRGLGKELLNLALIQALLQPEVSVVVLDVDSQNPAALALYRGAGFLPVYQVDYWSEIL